MSSRLCPKCSSVMSFRLGEYECTDCGHFEHAAPSEPDSSGPGFQRPRQWQGGIQPPGAPPPPPPAPGVGNQGLSEYSAFDLSSARAGTNPLHQEKMIYIGICAAMWMLLILLLISIKGLSDSLLADFETKLALGAVIAVVVATGAINIGLGWLALFTTQLWLKWTCIGCLSFSLLSTMFNMCAAMATAAAGEVVLGIFQFAMSCWYFSILYRDAHWLKSMR